MKANRTHKGRGVSLGPKTAEAVQRRIEKMDPWVKGFTDYVRRLIELDLELHILTPEGAPDDAVLNREKGRKRPFEPGRSSVLGEPGLSTS